MIAEEYPGQAADIEHERDVNAALTGLTAEVEAASLACGQALRYLTRLTDGDAWDIELAETGTGSDAADGLAAAARELCGVKRIVEARIALLDEADSDVQLGKVQTLVEAFEDGADAVDTVKAIGQVLTGRTPSEEAAVPVYPAPGSEIPGQPGYVVGECTHRVAGSEWRAGFRTCERCPSEPEPEVEGPYIVGPLTPEAEALWGHIRVGSTAAVHWKGGGYIVGHVRSKYDNHLIVVDDQQGEYDLVASDEIDQVVEDFPPAEAPAAAPVTDGGAGHE